MKLPLCLALLLLAVNACSSGKFIPTTYLTFKHLSETATMEQPQGPSITINRVTAAPGLNRQELIKRQSDFSITYQDHIRWITLPTELVAHSFTNLLTASGKFRNVANSTQMPKGDIQLNMELINLDYQHTDNKDIAFLTISIEAFDNQTGHRLWYKSFSTQKNFSMTNTTDIAQVQYSLLKEVSDQVVQLLTKQQ